MKLHMFLYFRLYNLQLHLIEFITVEEIHIYIFSVQMNLNLFSIIEKSTEFRSLKVISTVQYLVL
jgi:hypothetical protein